MQKSAFFKAMGLTLGAVVITACSSKGDIDDGAAEITAVEEQATTAVETVQLSAEELEAQAQEKLRQTRVFYFDFDSTTIKSDSKAYLLAHAAYLSANSSVVAKLEGHADERGTVEYNLALGERRGIAVRRFLMANGVSASQLDVVSYGEERPAVSGSSESSYQQNRRVEIKY